MGMNVDAAEKLMRQASGGSIPETYPVVVEAKG